MIATNVLLSLNRKMFYEVLIITTPILGILFILSLIISILQAATQLQDATLSTTPKLFCACLLIIFLSHWFMTQLAGFATYIFLSIPQTVHT